MRTRGRGLQFADVIYGSSLAAQHANEAEGALLDLGPHQRLQIRFRMVAWNSGQGGSERMEKPQVDEPDKSTRKSILISYSISSSVSVKIT